jgi:protein TonB
VSASFDRPVSERAISLGIVAALHAALLLLIVARGGVVPGLTRVAEPVQLLPADRPPPPPPPPIRPTIPPPELLPVPVPEIAVAPPPTASGAPRAILRVAPSGPPAAHFGLAGGDAGLGVALATTRGGGARGRGNLGDFEAAVKHAILIHKVQPVLAWDRRNTCVVNYTASVAPDGSLAGLSIDACAIPEINEAARAAIRNAAPFPPPPDLGGRKYDVHGTLIFHP